MSPMQNMAGQQSSSYQRGSVQNTMYGTTPYQNQQSIPNIQQQGTLPAQYPQNRQILPQMVNPGASTNVNINQNPHFNPNPLPVPYVVRSAFSICYVLAFGPDYPEEQPDVLLSIQR